MMKPVWRLEDGEGKGAYAGERAFCLNNAYDPKRQPEPWADFKAPYVHIKGCSKKETIFGFPSWPALCRWFNLTDLGEVERCVPEGANIALYLVEHVRTSRSKRQVLFCSGRAMLVGRLALSAYVQRLQEEKVDVEKRLHRKHHPIPETINPFGAKPGDEETLSIITNGPGAGRVVRVDGEGRAVVLGAEFGGEKG